MSRVKERSSRGLQYAIVQGARIGDRGGSPCGERWYDIEGSPVYTTPMRERGIEPRSLPWRGSGLPLTDSRTLFEIRRTDRIHESIGRRANADDTGLTRRWATNERREHFGECDTTTLHPVLWDGVGGIEPPIFRSKYLPPTVRPCGIPESNGVLRFGGPPCDLHTHAAMLPPGFEPGSPRRGRGMASVAPQQRCRQPESNRRPTFEGRRCLTALHHDGVAAPRFARGPRLCKSRILGARPCCHHSPLRKSGGPRERKARQPASPARDSASSSDIGDRRSGLERIRTPPPLCKSGVLPITPRAHPSGEGVEPSRALRPARYPPTIAAWRLAVRPAGQRRKEWSRCPP